ncbi:tRNA (uracil(54)-C(5))-methyltransferase homolog-B-like [Stegodyphus dumicola]|uniref:tRNA (uracil(54)-C(5))-methyltransferase homolog-B-like n=1 Tax=Stegodyphus dumicola TaxID=202533 RepID=UPI0015B0C39E|nr:tRNA (uracil(54)-C(5))-methyltransferase homolog-B-like [Stegodyphus dumicola]
MEHEPQDGLVIIVMSFVFISVCDDFILQRKHKKCLTCLRLLGEKLHSNKVPITLGPDKLPCPVELVLPSPVIDSYRNKDEFSIGPGVDGSEKTVGFYVNSGVDHPSKYCINPDEISIIKDSHKALIKDFQNYIRQSSLPASIMHDDGGYWRNISVRSNEKNDLMAVVVMNPQALTKEELQTEKEKLKNYFSTIPKSYNLRSLYFQACSLSSPGHEQAPFELLLGEPCVIEELNGLKLRISPGSYFLTNTKIVESVNDTLLKLCKVKNSTTVIDVCCGIGPLSLSFSRKVKRCIGIDASAEAINDANVNAAANNKGNVDFIQGCVEHLLKIILNDAFHEDLLVVINPSKINLRKTIVNSLRECKHLKKIIYISTKPQNSLEDFVQLCKPCGLRDHFGKPFYPILAVPVDFFPQTDHFGLILMLQRL